jgi:RHS repeat-associated protein
MGNGGTEQNVGFESIHRYWYHGDHLGSAQTVTNWTGELHERIEYTPYGELWIEHKYEAEEGALPYRFTGKELDSETGFYYYGARYMDPKTSRWISGDPAMGEYIPGAPVNDEVRKQNGNLPGGGGIFNLVNLHVYHYAGNNPLKYTDPDGRKDRPLITGISGVLPLVGEVNTGNSSVDQFLAGSGSTWNAIASVANAVVNYAGDLVNASDAAITLVDDLIPDEYSLTGLGLKEDMYVGSLFVGMNPGMVTTGIQHAKNLATVVQSSLGGSQKISNAVQSISDWLGSDVQMKTNKDGDKIFLSANGDRRVRFDLNNPSPHNSPHGHVEELINGHWVKSGPVFPSDVPPN